MFWCNLQMHKLQMQSSAALEFDTMCFIRVRAVPQNWLSSAPTFMTHLL